MTAKLSTMQANHELFSSVNADVSDIHECFWMLSKEVSLLLVAAESVNDNIEAFFRAGRLSQLDDPSPPEWAMALRKDVAIGPLSFYYQSCWDDLAEITASLDEPGLPPEVSALQTSYSKLIDAFEAVAAALEGVAKNRAASLCWNRFVESNAIAAINSSKISVRRDALKTFVETEFTNGAEIDDLTAAQSIHIQDGNVGMYAQFTRERAAALRELGIGALVLSTARSSLIKNDSLRYGFRSNLSKTASELRHHAPDIYRRSLDRAVGDSELWLLGSLLFARLGLAIFVKGDKEIKYLELDMGSKMIAQIIGSIPDKDKVAEALIAFHNVSGQEQSGYAELVENSVSRALQAWVQPSSLLPGESYDIAKEALMTRRALWSFGQFSNASASINFDSETSEVYFNELV